MTDTNRSYSAERDFGLIVGGIFTLISAWWLFRGRFTASSYELLVFGLLLVILAVSFPRALKYPNKIWMAFAEALGYVSSRVILGVVFFGIVTPIGVIKRLFGWDPLNRRGKPSDSYWRPYSERQRDPKHYEKMF